MKNFIFRLPVYLLVGSSLACSPGTSLSVEQLDGLWVRENYLNSLKSTRSPFRILPESIQIASKNNRLDWANYHEGLAKRIVRIKPLGGKYALILRQWDSKTSQPDDDPYEFNVTRDQDENISALTFLTGSLIQNKNERFTRLEMPLAQYANQLILAGEYVDQDGKHYSFNKEGIATWPNEHFSFEISLDSSEAACDYFQTDDSKEPGGRKRYGFRWEDSELHLFNIFYDRDWPIQCDEKPFVTLSRR